jgi:DNA invertase Pin-like site-specific DNA recombinase
MLKAFSYLRFSTPDQFNGDSFRRQTEAARAYADKHGLELDDLTFHDLGVSAFRGANAVDGALAQFITAVDTGRVPKGSYLLVENLDRLSRDKIMAALSRFSALLERGITVVTLSDGKVWTTDSLNNLPDLMWSLLVMSRARDESETKSRRLLAAWANKRDRATTGGHKMTGKAPAWLRLHNGAFVVVEDRAALVRRIFALALAGHGKAGIAKALNAEGIAPFGDGPSEARKADGWHPSYIHKILANEAVIGRYQPMRRVWTDGVKSRATEGAPIESYFPVILSDPADFYRLRRGMGLSGHGTSEPVNALSGIARCSRCGGAMHYINKGAPPKGSAYLACDGARRKGTCTAKSVRYRGVLDALIAAMGDGAIDLRSLASGDAQDRKRELAGLIEATAGKITGAEVAIGNLLDVLSRVPSPAIEARLAGQEAALVQLRAEKLRLEREASEIAVEGDPAGDVLAVLAEVNQGGGDTVLRLNAALKRIVERVEIGTADEARQWMAAGVAWADRHTGGQPFPDALYQHLYTEVMEGASLSIAAVFRTPGRHLVICADPRRPARFVAGAVQEIDGDIQDFTLKVWAL